MQHQLNSRFEAVSQFVDRACGSEAPEEFKSYLFKFGTVLVCGNVEQCIKIVVMERLTKRAHARVLAFVGSHFRRGTNYDCDAIGQLLVRFDAEWYRKFKDFVAANPDVDDGMTSAYAVRNSVAHGGTAGIGGARLKELLTVSQRLIEGVVAATSS